MVPDTAALNPTTVLHPDGSHLRPAIPGSASECLLRPRQLTSLAATTRGTAIRVIARAIERTGMTPDRHRMEHTSHSLHQVMIGGMTGRTAGITATGTIAIPVDIAISISDGRTVFAIVLAFVYV
jgi:hypothetical protein